MITTFDYERLHRGVKKQIRQIESNLRGMARRERQTADETGSAHTDEFEELYREAARHLDRAVGVLETIESRSKAPA